MEGEPCRDERGSPNAPQPFRAHCLPSPGTTTPEQPRNVMTVGASTSTHIRGPTAALHAATEQGMAEAIPSRIFVPLLPTLSFCMAKEGDAGECSAPSTCSSTGHQHQGYCSDTTTLNHGPETRLGIRAASCTSISDVHVLFLEMMARRRPFSYQYKQTSSSVGCITRAKIFSFAGKKQMLYGEWKTSQRNPFSLVFHLLCQTPKES